MLAVLRGAGALALCVLVSACLVTPGTFLSTLDIRADRRFSFSYQGEILASDMGKGAIGSDPQQGDAPAGENSADGAALLMPISDPRADGAMFGDSDGDDARQMQAIATALAKEKGFRSARYLGNHKFAIDYAISGRLDHGFIFPFNIDAQIILPFVAAELRGDDRVRVKAPGFANSFVKSQGPASAMGGPGEDAAKALDGTFTLTTDAEIISQNEEYGARTVPQGKQIVWTITPLTSEAPAATLRLAQ